MDNKIQKSQMLDRSTIYSVSATLLQNNIITAHPDVDINGADLLAIMQIEDGAKFARIQCKGRTLKNESATCHIDIKKEYVTGTFTCILKIRYANESNEYLFCFFVNDIKGRADLWKDKGSHFTLHLYGKTFKKKLDLFYLTQSRIGALQEIIRESDANKEFHYSFGNLELSLPGLQMG